VSHYPGVRSSLLAILVIGLTTAWCPAASWPPIAPEEMALTSIPEQPGAPAVILNREEIDDDTAHDQRVYMRLKVLTEAGRKYADVELPYNRKHFTISDVSGRTVHADGSIVPFQGKPFDKVVVKGHNIRIQVKAFTLPDVQVGSVLEYRYVLGYDDNALYSPEWTVQDELFQKRAFFKFVPFQFGGSRYVEVERGRTANGVAWTPFLPAGHATQIHTRPDGFNWVELEMKNVPAFIEEPYMPPADPMKWRVYFYYQVELKPDEYWKNEGKYWNKTAENFMGRKNGVAEAVTAMIAASDPPAMKVRKIYAFVSGLQNQSYDPPRAQQEDQAMGIKPNAGVDDALRQKSGDHDELNRLFVAMVRAAGIPAWLMRVPDRENMIFVQQYMSTQQFDAEIAIVQLGDKETFFDPGSKFCPYSLLSWHYSDDQGLRQSSAKGTEFGDSPHATYKQAMIQRVAQLKLTDQGTVEGTLVVGFFGLEGMIRRREAGKTDAEGRKKLLEDEIKTWLPGGSDVTLTSIPDWQGVGSLMTEFKISSPLATSAGKRWIVPLHVFQVNQKPLFAPAQRTLPIYFYYPSQEVDEVHLTLPPNMEVESVPPDDKVHLDYALYETIQKPEGPNGIVSVRNLIMGGIAFPVSEYKNLKGFYDKVKAGDDQPVVLKGSVHAQAN
jgi:hypothetical protein